MKHLGDITKIDGHKVPITDVVIGGSPCQDLSVAGKRAGLDGERSGLFMEQIRVIKEMRDEDRRNGRTDVFVRPRYMVWENVPGALSSPGGERKGEDFRAVLEETARVADPNATIPRPKDGKWTTSGCILGNGWSIAWRILDLQFWGATYFDDEGVPTKLGTPQRRRRIALVADFNGESAGQILFESYGSTGNLAESGNEGQGTARDTEESVGEPGCTAEESVVSFDPSFSSYYGGTTFTDVAKTLANGTAPGFHDAVAYGIDQQGGKGGANYAEDKCPPILSDSHGTPHAVAYGLEPGAAQRLNTESRFTEEVAPTLRENMGDNQAAVAFAEKRFFKWEEDERSVSLRANSGSYGGGSETLVAETEYVEDRKQVVENADGGRNL